MALLSGWASSALAVARAPMEGPGDFGVLVMAHGGTPEWDKEVLAAVEPLKSRYKVEVAFGMADPATIQDAAAKLEAQGVKRVGVVRLFISGESWLERTEQILGLRPGAPPRPAPSASSPHAGHGDHHNMDLWRIDTGASFALTTQGLNEAEGMGTILADRARSLSRNPGTEDVLILAHGPGDDAENARWIATIDARAESVRKSQPFRRVEVMTLREDWPDKRPEAERKVRGFLERAKAEGGAAIVLPFRLQGFGPYAEVLAGLEYVSDGHGLLPHANVTRWIEGQIKGLEPGRSEPRSGNRPPFLPRPAPRALRARCVNAQTPGRAGAHNRIWNGPVRSSSEGPPMAKCDTCGNDYDRAFQVVVEGRTHTFDSFECAIQRLAPNCAHCGVRIIGHGLQKGERIFCCDHCAEKKGVTELRDRA